MLGEDLCLRLKKKKRKGILWKYLKLKEIRNVPLGECLEKIYGKQANEQLP